MATTNYRNKPTLNSIFAYVNVAQKNNSKKEDTKRHLN